MKDMNHPTRQDQVTSEPARVKTYRHRVWDGLIVQINGRNELTAVLQEPVEPNWPYVSAAWDHDLTFSEEEMETYFEEVENDAPYCHNV